MAHYELVLSLGKLTVFDKPGGTIKNTFHASEMQSCNVLAGSKTQPPSDFPFDFALTVGNRNVYLFAASKEEREIWVELLTRCIKNKKSLTVQRENLKNRDMKNKSTARA